ncbi:unnamed protein product, partial [Nesidiocoris tenuis]
MPLRQWFNCLMRTDFLKEPELYIVIIPFKSIAECLEECWNGSALFRSEASGCGGTRNSLSEVLTVALVCNLMHMGRQALKFAPGIADTSSIWCYLRTTLIGGIWDLNQFFVYGYGSTVLIK